VPRPQRKLVDSSSNHAVVWDVQRGPLTTVLIARSGFVGQSTLERRITLYKNFPRIDFQTELDLRVPNVVITVDFPLHGAIVERARGIPYAFASIAPRVQAAPPDYFLMRDHRLYGTSAAIAPAVRWSDYALAEGGGLALLDRGLPCHELNGSTVTLAL